MKVMIISKDPNKQGREKTINQIVDAFGRDKDFEFYAYGAKNNDMKIDNVTLIPAWEKYTAEGGIAFSRYIGDTGKMFVVFENGRIPNNLSEILDYHIKGQYGITACLYERDDKYYACGVYIVEREYLDLADGYLSFEREICVRCGENGELGIYSN